jgi:hypothetical protein
VPAGIDQAIGAKAGGQRMVLFLHTGCVAVQVPLTSLADDIAATSKPRQKPDPNNAPVSN